MMTPAEWNVAMHADRPWREAYGDVSRVVREFLSPPIGETYSTNELVELLYPEALSRGDGLYARARIFKALMALAVRGLADCASRGDPRKLKHTGRSIKPWVWHAPGERNAEYIKPQACPHCGGEL